MLVKKIQKNSTLRFKSDPLVKKMINLLMRHGKRSKAEKALDKAFSVLDKKYPGQAYHIFYLAVIAVRQDIGVRLKPKPKKRRSKESFDVYLPRLISPLCGINLGIRSILKASRKASQTSFSPFWESLSEELLEASQNKGKVVAKRYSINDLAFTNKRKVHFGIRK